MLNQLIRIAQYSNHLQKHVSIKHHRYDINVLIDNAMDYQGPISIHLHRLIQPKLFIIILLFVQLYIMDSKIIDTKLHLNDQSSPHSPYLSKNFFLYLVHYLYLFKTISNQFLILDKNHLK